MLLCQLPCGVSQPGAGPPSCTASRTGCFASSPFRFPGRHVAQKKKKKNLPDDLALLESTFSRGRFDFFFSAPAPAFERPCSLLSDTLRILFCPGQGARLVINHATLHAHTHTYTHNDRVPSPPSSTAYSCVCMSCLAKLRALCALACRSHVHSATRKPTNTFTDADAHTSHTTHTRR